METCILKLNGSGWERANVTSKCTNGEKKLRNNRNMACVSCVANSVLLLCRLSILTIESRITRLHNRFCIYIHFFHFAFLSLWLFPLLGSTVRPLHSTYKSTTLQVFAWNSNWIISSHFMSNNNGKARIRRRKRRKKPAKRLWLNLRFHPEKRWWSIF